MTFKTVWCGVPMLTFMGHLSLIYAYVFPTRITELREHSLKTHTTEWSAFSHYISLSTKLGVALETREMFHMPATSLCLCTFISKNNLKTLQKGKL
jgi:hypothetical protein